MSDCTVLCPGIVYIHVINIDRYIHTYIFHIGVYIYILHALKSSCDHPKH
jgi:hypothetical protein